jgi:hypothetical protein
MTTPAWVPQPPYNSYEEFWPFYMSQHLSPVCRALHFVGTLGAFGWIAAAAATQNPWLLAAAPVTGYGFAWIGHFFVEKNKPATFTYPLWSLRGDLRMYRYMLLGQMRGELERLAQGGRAAPARAAS